MQLILNRFLLNLSSNYNIFLRKDKIYEKWNIRELFATIATRWRNIGDALGVSNNDLESL